MKTFIRFFIAALAMTTVAAQADSAPAQFSGPGFNAPDTNDVRGVRLAALYGKSGNMTGVDVALGLSELDNMKGVSLPLFIGANRVRNEMTGLAIGLVNIHEGSDAGVNLGLLNLTQDVNGLNWGAVNISEGTTLADVSLVNFSQQSTFQLGYFNKTDQLKGIQIGLLNCADNGFFPCFPIFNFPK